MNKHLNGHSLAGMSLSRNRIQDDFYATPEESTKALLAVEEDAEMKKYQIIYCDPPWRFKNWSMKELAVRGEKWARKYGRSPYDVMDNQEIYKLPIKKLADRNCILFLWATYPKLQEALETIKAWGFIYKTVAFTWVKQNKVADGWHFGLGYWTRGNPEICLLATTGKPKRKSKFVANLTISHLGEHSAKPPIIREKIVELMGDLPRIELFARQKTEGWDVWGNEIESDITLSEGGK